MDEGFSGGRGGRVEEGAITELSFGCIVSGRGNVRADVLQVALDLRKTGKATTRNKNKTSKTEGLNRKEGAW